jgi:hypothetical protein
MLYSKQSAPDAHTHDAPCIQLSGAPRQGKIKKKKLPYDFHCYTSFCASNLSDKHHHAHSPSMAAPFCSALQSVHSSTSRFHTFPNFGKYHKFSFLLYGATMPPRERRDQVNCLLPCYFHFHWIKI